MSRINDVGGMEGFGPLQPTTDDPPFHADWEARVFALNSALLRRGVYNLDEFRDAIERMPPGEYLRASYYARWMAAMRTLLVEKGVVTTEDLAGEAPEQARGPEETA
jgi:nitrile hydratase subunit beta